MDTIPGDKRGENKVLRSTVSRFACRILCDRSNPRIARVYAAGFDSSRNIFLGVSVISELLYMLRVAGFGAKCMYPCPYYLVETLNNL